MDAEYESLDYHVPNNQLRREYLERKGGEHSQLEQAMDSFITMMLSGLIGAITGTAAFGVFYLIELLSAYKYSMFIKTLTNEDYGSAAVHFL